MNRMPTLGQVLRRHEKVGFQDIGRVVLLLPEEQAFWYVPLPRQRGKATRDQSPESAASKDIGGKAATVGSPTGKRKPKNALEYQLRKPRRKSLDALGDDFSFVEFVIPLHWHITENELKTGIVKSDIVGRRASPKDWYDMREKQKTLIEPIWKEYGLYELLECGRLRDEVAQRAKELGIEHRRLMQVMLQHILGLGHRNSLLPAYARSGAPGKEKVAAAKPGRKRDAVANKRSTDNGYHCSATDRKKLAKGWRDYKKPDVSEEEAWLLTCAEYWPGRWQAKSRGGREYMLAPPLERPSIGQFRGAARRAGQSARRVDMGERVHRECRRAQRGTARDGTVAVGQIMLVDSTSEDETPVSELNILDLLPSTWRTTVFDVHIEYIFGVHSGFENPSTLTGLMALHNAATPKEEFCARYGEHIKPGEWYHLMPKRVRTDNGELKSETGIETLNDSETAIEFTRSYGATYKGAQEANHRSLHKHADHRHAGSTKGRQRARGEPSRNKEACRTHFQNMKSVIQAILRHNNEVPVPHLLTMEMRHDKVKPTRRAILEWCIKRGYVASEPSDIDSLRIQCLPRLRAVIHQDGVRLFDPRTDKANRLVKYLTYSSDWLIESGLCEKAGASKPIHTEVFLDPNELRECYLFRGGELRRLELRRPDALVHEITLCEYLLMCDDDKDQVEGVELELQEKDTKRIVENRRVNQQARAKRKKAEKASDAGGANADKSGKRENKVRELEIERAKKLGLPVNVQPSTGGPAPARSPSPQGRGAEQDTPDDEDDTQADVAAMAHGATSSLMAKLRANRRG